jgi:hypothetical protein
MRDKSISKKQELITKYSFNESIVLECLSTLRETKNFYSNYDMGDERYLLHLRDLLLLFKLSPTRYNANLNFVYKKIYLDVRNLFPGQKLLREMLLRRLYRLI